MKANTSYIFLAILPLLASCASQPVVLAPVGPDPMAFTGTPGPSGYLRVYSARDPVTDGQYDGNPTFYQHSDYTIYDAGGKRFKHVFNTIGHFDTAPRLVSLPPGLYVVKARAKDYLSLEVPVVIKPGRLTDVHLDDRWNPPPGLASNRLVTEPDGVPVGWQANSPLAASKGASG